MSVIYRATLKPLTFNHATIQSSNHSPIPGRHCKMIYGNFIFATFLMALPIAFAQSPSPTSTLCATAVTYLQLETLPPNPAEFEASMESKYITYEVTAPITTAGDRVRVGFVENEGLYAVLESYIRSENLPIVTLTSTQSVRCPTALPPSPTGLGKCTVRVDQCECAFTPPRKHHYMTAGILTSMQRAL